MCLRGDDSTSDETSTPSLVAFSARRKLTLSPRSLDRRSGSGWTDSPDAMHPNISLLITFDNMPSRTH